MHIFLYFAIMLRAAFFTAVGVTFLVFWLITNPSYEEKDTQDEWPQVLAFSAVILTLAFALPLLAQLAGRRNVFRLSLIPAAGAALSSVANIVEDGLRVRWMFFGFVLGTSIILLGLLVLAVALVRGGRGRARLLAVVPAGTMAGVIVFVVAGGPVLLVTWLAAAALALATPKATAARDAI